jgi:hypothetical protein
LVGQLLCRLGGPGSGQGFFLFLLGAFAALPLGLLAGLLKVNVLGCLDGCARSRLGEPVADRSFQARRERGHVILDVQPFSTAFLQYVLTGYADLAG